MTHTPHPSAPARRTPVWLADRWLLGLMVGGLGLRVAVALLVHPDLHPVGDAETYRLQAEFLAHTGRLETGHFVRPPLYFAVLAAIYSLAAGWDWTLAARLAQCVASAATAIPVYRSARRIGACGRPAWRPPSCSSTRP